MENNSSEIKPRRRYKIDVGDELIVYKSELNGRTFYKVLLKKKYADGNSLYFYKYLKFKKDVNLENKTKIKILDFFEDVDVNKKNKYQPYWSIFVTKFEIVDNSISDDIYYNTQKEMNGIVEPDIDKDYEALDEISDEDLPF